MPSPKTAAAECISEEALVHLKSYKYSSVDKSPISYHILRHYWNGCVKLLPMWLAPNLVTLLGFMAILANILILQIFVPDLIGPAPRWVYFSFAAGLWAYSTMDNIDGKQARRTGTSSPLGELFDHGIDSLNCTLGSLLETAAMGLGASKVGAFTALVPCLPMFFSTWETYHTHTLYLGYFNGPTEGLILACSIMLASGFFGPQIWHAPLSELLGSSFPAVLQGYESYRILDAWVGIILFSFFTAHLPSCVYNVYEARKARGEALLPTLIEWTQMIVYVAASAAWLGSPDSIILKDNWLVLHCLTQSFVFGRMTTKIILAHLTKQPFPQWTVLITPLVIGAAIANARKVGLPTWTPQVELVYLCAYFGFAFIVYARWAFLVINAICDYLGINCLTIPDEKRKQNATKLG